MKHPQGVTHITPAGSNVFAELGFAAEEAAQLHAHAREQIATANAMKLQLMRALAAWINEHQLKQADAAERLGVSRPRVSDVVNLKSGKFTIDTLVNLVGLTGRSVELTIR